MPSRIRVALRPTYTNKNPYTHFVADELKARGLEAEELRGGLRYPWGAHVVVIHWPDEFARRKGFLAEIRALVLLGQLLAGKLLGQRLVWFVHELESHARGLPAKPMTWRLFLWRVDGLVFLSRTSKQQASERYPQLAAKPALLTSHGVYATGEDAPRADQPRPGKVVRLGFIGRIEPYKQPVELARAVASLPGGGATLIISGLCRAPNLEAELRSLASDRVQLSIGYHSDQKLARLVRSLDAVVLPYADIMNSGSVLFALSQGRPVMAPAKGSLPELAGEVGPDWLWLYEGEFSLAVLEAFTVWCRERRPRAPPDLSGHQWDKIGSEIAAFLRSLHSGSKLTACP